LWSDNDVEFRGRLSLLLSNLVSIAVVDGMRIVQEATKVPPTLKDEALDSAVTKARQWLRGCSDPFGGEDAPTAAAVKDSWCLSICDFLGS
jgi:hypothetical protein